MTLHAKISTIKSYPVAENIEEVVQNLGFYESNSCVDDWRVFARKEFEPEFVALFHPRDANEYVVWGIYENINESLRDLEKITQYFLSKPKASQFWKSHHEKYLRNTSLVLVMGGAANLLLSGNPHVTYGLMGGSIISLIGLGIINQSNNRKLHRLSDKSSSYLLGKDAESRLAIERQYKFMDEDERKDCYLQHMGFLIRNQGYEIPLQPNCPEEDNDQ